MRLERGVRAVEQGEGAARGAAEHAEDGDAGGAEEGDFGPEGVEAWVGRGVVVEVERGGGGKGGTGGVEVDGG